MSSINTKFAILALAGSAVAVPSFGHGKHHGKHHHHNKHFFGSSGVATGTGAPYGMANATGIWGTGTAASAGLPSGHSFVHPSAVGPHTGSSEVAAEGATTSTCTSSVVSITHTNRVTITVHATSAEAAPVQTTFSTKAYTSSADVNSTTAAFSSAVALSSSVLVESSATSSSSSVIVAESSAAALDLDLQNKGHRKWTRSSTAAASTSTAAAESTSATSVAPVSTSTSSSSSTSTSSTVAVAPTSAVAVSSSTQASSTSSSAVPTSSSTGNGKRGLAYNTASLMTCFEGSSQVSWGYNWDSDSAGLSSSFNYVPLLWGLSHTDVWNSRATSAIANGATHLMSFNEPDMTSQANMSPEDAASAYKTYMMPFAGKAKLGAPAVTNGGGSMGLNWLAAFLEACDGCQIDFVTIHWYDSASNTAYFKEHVQNATDVAGGKPVWVTEFAPTGSPSNADISTFLEDVMPWMDSQSFVERYSYFMASDGALISGTEPSTFGQTYATYTS